jgi:inorganic phosphate transporter, PiT family
MAASSSRMMGCGLRAQAITARRVIVRGVTVEDDGVFTIPGSATMTSQRDGAMALGTLLGGWRIVRTMGSRITRLHPVQGFYAEAGGAATLFIATAFGVPVSTTHTITGAIVGVGAARKVSAVRWNVATDVVIAWVLTMPAAALIGAAFYKLGELLQ